MDGQGVLVADRYRLRRRVGAGGMGVVWEAWDERLNRAVALKLLHRPPPGLDEAQADLANLRVMREARITARLHHRYAVPVFDVVEHEGQTCLVMPFLSSMTLAAVLREAGPLSVAEVGTVGGQIASALAAAHEAGIVHRDVKPGNILISDDGTALISDFGIAHAFGEASLTTTGLIHGTLAYLAPEVARGREATDASDVFSLGATLYDALEGTPPFGTDQNSIALLHRIAAARFEHPKRAGALTPILLQMLDADPQSRPSMAAVAQSLPELARAPESANDQQRLTSVVETDDASKAVPPTTPNAVAAVPPEMSTADRETPQSGTRPPRVASQPERTTPRRRRRWLLVGALLIAVILAGGTTTTLFLQHQAQDNVTTGSSGASHRASASANRPTPSASATSTPSRSRSPAAAPPSSRSTPSATTQSTVRGTPTAGQLAHAITSYYALMPDHTDEGWPRMTAGYQANHAGGRTAYENFWRPVRRVTVADVIGRPPDHAVATITYYYRDGRVVRERTEYQLVNQAGELKIVDSRVISSTKS